MVPDVAALLDQLPASSDDFARLAGTDPDQFRPFQETVAESFADRFEVNYDDLCVLFAGASDRCVEILAGRPADDFRSAWMLAAIGTPAALTAVAERVRAGGDRSEFEDCGLWVPPHGPAERRFTPERRAIFLEVGGFPGADHPVGLPISVVADAPAVWHYLSVRLDEIPGLPSWPATHAHLVAPESTDRWTLFAAVDPGGRYHDVLVELTDGEDDEEDDDGFTFQDDRSFGLGRVVLRPYGPGLVYSNGHIHSTPGVVGTAGGPPIGLYPNPACPKCERLMFHVATVTSMVREHGDGFRSLYLCENCKTAAVTATSWN
ncbi:hypothetical protein [Actinoplanes couchii]|uniref:Uncharacterized protein n=1 Tax=Actinoplanes couchii TaxID=403638 RepID=A0ABQ3XHK3_9ACTN|nr:hypothetical protein [Actinoplanes couchii]MDR6317576.1 hypothetical protein [Actinoplanes couchii]GID57961.1 hypothetical protein Aco03nite_063650 [Actinoplanes couchii]